ncbi:centrobin isoform X2 [Dendroctonus ponderosae]|uniref:centrobin isoform X2 n=1 Tax=Dendroctonus ponderosae TaxID=77166 RepID=UPI002034E4F8|nr:centrobin isoform X2 [Dendroctonus ponderosae]
MARHYQEGSTSLYNCQAFVYVYIYFIVFFQYYVFMIINILKRNVQSEPEPPYFGIVDSLIKQVSNLQDRIEGIESMSDVSLSSHIVQLPDLESSPNMYKKQPNAKRYYSHDDLYQTVSSQTTPQKSTDKLRLSSLPNTPIAARFTPKKNTVKFSPPHQALPIPSAKKPISGDTEVLQEIDTFISNVQAIKRNHAVRNLENTFSQMEASNTKMTTENGRKSSNQDEELQETIRQLDRHSEKIAVEKRPKADGLVQEPIGEVNAWQCGDNINSVPEYGAGFRNQLYSQKEAKHPYSKFTLTQPESTTTDLTSTNTSLEKSLDSSSDSTQLTAYHKLTRKEGLGQFATQLQTEHKEPSIPNFKKYPPPFDASYNDVYKIDQERNELLHSPLHDNALSILNMHKQLLENSKVASKDERVPKKRNNMGLLSLADIWDSNRVSQSPSKLTQKIQEERLRRQHCEQLIQELQYTNLVFQQKLAVAVKVDETKNNTIQQFRDALNSLSSKLEKLNEEKASWDRDVARLKNDHSMAMESASQKAAYYEKDATRSRNVLHANQEKISALEERCSQLQHQLKQIEEKFGEVQENYQRESTRNQQLADIISQKEIELKENKSVLSIARDEVSHSRKAVEVCQAEFTALKNECSKLKTELSEDKSTILNLTEQKRKILNDIQTYKTNEKNLKDALEESKLKLDNTKVELRNFYQGQLEIIVENKRKEMQSQLDQQRQNGLEEISRKELSMAKTAANHIKEISDKCALEIKLLEQKHQEEMKLYQAQLTQKDKTIESLQAKVAQLPEKRAQIAKQLQKAMENQWNEALKMISGGSTPLSNDQQGFAGTNPLFHAVADSGQLHKQLESASDYDETPVSSRGAKQSESEIQKYINMLLNRPPGNPVTEPQDTKTTQSQMRSTGSQGELEGQSKDESRQFRDRKTGKPPWK